MFRHILLFFIFTFSQISFASADKEFDDLFKELIPSRRNFRIVTYNVHVLEQQLAEASDEATREDLEYRLDFAQRQVLAYDRDYSSKINDILKIMRRDPEMKYVKKLLDQYRKDVKEFFEKLNANADMVKLKPHAGRISIISTLIGEYYLNEKLTPDHDLSNYYFEQFHRLQLISSAEYFARDEMERTLLRNEIQRIRTAIEKFQKLVNSHALTVSEIACTNAIIHQILILSRKYRLTTYDYSKLDQDIVFKHDPEGSPTKLALELIRKQWEILKNSPRDTIKFDEELSLLESTKTFERHRTDYIRIDNIDFFAPVYLPMDSIDKLISEVSHVFEFMHEGLYEEKIAKNINPSTLDHVVYLKKHPPLEEIPLTFGEWKLSMASNYYITVTGGPNFIPAHKNIKDTYDSMQSGLKLGLKDFTKGVRSFLRNGGVDNPELNKSEFDQARLTYAKFVSEPARNFKTWLINLMMLDLIEIGVIKNKGEFFTRHPMRGGSYAHQAAEGENKNKDQIVTDETLIVANWLRHFWPRDEAVSFTNEVEASYFKDVQKKSETEEYYYNLVIRLLFHRMKNSSFFTSRSFKAGDNILGISNQNLPRLLRTYLPIGILKKVKGDKKKAEQLTPLYNAYAPLFDIFSIKNEGKEFLEEMLKNSSPELKDFWSKKLKDFEANELESHRKKFLDVLNQILEIQGDSISMSEDGEEEIDSKKENKAFHSLFDKIQRYLQPGTFEATHDGITQIFREISASPIDNNCAFEVLGITRKTAIEQLLDNSYRADIRTLVADDIVAALIGNELPESMRSELTEELVGRYELFANLVDIDHIRHQDDSLNTERLNATIIQIRQYANQESTYTNFVTSYLRNQPGMLSYIREGHGLLDAVAELNGLEVNVWVNPNEEENTLTRVHHYQPTGPVQRTINMHHTWGMTHFNHLHPVDSNPQNFSEDIQRQHDRMREFYNFLLFQIMSTKVSSPKNL